MKGVDWRPKSVHLALRGVRDAGRLEIDGPCLLEKFQESREEYGDEPLPSQIEITGPPRLKVALGDEEEDEKSDPRIGSATNRREEP